MESPELFRCHFHYCSSSWECIDSIISLRNVSRKSHWNVISGFQWIIIITTGTYRCISRCCYYWCSLLTTYPNCTKTNIRNMKKYDSVMCCRRLAIVYERICFFFFFPIGTKRHLMATPCEWINERICSGINTRNGKWIPAGWQPRSLRQGGRGSEKQGSQVVLGVTCNQAIESFRCEL